MITALDSSVLLDVFLADPDHGPRSKEALRSAVSEGSLVACDVVWAEVSGVFTDTAEASRAMHQLGVSFVPLGLSAALGAGEVWRRYRRAGGPRTRVVADFLVGAHAVESADRLLSRDRGFYRRYFSDLTVVDPSRGRRS